MANTKVGFKGVEEIKSKLRRLVEQSKRGTENGLKVWGEETITVTMAEFVPVEFGRLRASGKAELKEEGGSPSVELSFEAPHAIPVHEIPARHSVGGDKYLEKGAIKESSKLLDTVGDEVKKHTGMR